MFEIIFFNSLVHYLVNYKIIHVYYLNKSISWLKLRMNDLSTYHIVG